MISLPFLLFYIVAAVVCIVKIVSKHFDFFEKRGIKFQKPYPFVGTNGWLLKKGVFPDFLRETYKKFSNEKFYGLFDFNSPALVLKDPDVIKRFLVKDFDYFTDHRSLFSAKSSELLNSTMLLMHGQKWREMRSSLSPAFTGSKMRLMFDFIGNCGQQMVDNIHAEYKKTGQHSEDMKLLFTKFTNDVIATCAFGLKCDSFKDPDNEFYSVGRQFLDMRKPSMMFKMLMMRYLPSVSDFFNIDFFDSKMKNFFHETIIDTMKIREEKKIVRPDMINILMQLKKGELETSKGDDGADVLTDTKKNWTDTELIAQCFIFFLAGFETSSSLMVLTAYELATNPEIQEKLIEEIAEVKEKLNGKPITYEAVLGMKYLDMVISESLRKWPPAVLTDRVCVKPYKYQEENNGVRFEMDVGDMIWVPIFALHRDPMYFPNPEKFDPERFNDENKNNINSNVYMPFGAGPRNCIGSRFALLETKTILFYLLSNFSFEVCEKTPVPLKLQPGVIALSPKDKIILSLKPLNK